MQQKGFPQKRTTYTPFTSLEKRRLFYFVKIQSPAACKQTFIKKINSSQSICSTKTLSDSLWTPSIYLFSGFVHLLHEEKKALLGGHPSVKHTLSYLVINQPWNHHIPNEDTYWQVYGYICGFLNVSLVILSLVSLAP